MIEQKFEQVEIDNRTSLSVKLVTLQNSLETLFIPYTNFRKLGGKLLAGITGPNPDSEVRILYQVSQDQIRQNIYRVGRKNMVFNMKKLLNVGVGLTLRIQCQIASLKPASGCGGIPIFGELAAIFARLEFAGLLN
jgi:hypothetical protein